MGIPTFISGSWKAGVSKICMCDCDLYRVPVSIFCVSRSGWLVVQDVCIFAVGKSKMGLLGSCAKFSGFYPFSSMGVEMEYL